jgi:CBS domain-containing protein
MLLPVDPLLALRIRGIRTTVRVSTLLVLCLVCGGAMAGLHDGPSTQSVVWMLGTILTSFAVVVALASQVLAGLWICRRLGVEADRIHVLSFGGVLSIRDETASPRAEAILGAVSLSPLLLLTGLVGLAFAAVGDTPSNAPDLIVAVAVALGGLAVLQVFPGLGLGGGRILRALVWYLTDNPLVGARAGAIYSYALGAGLMMGGVGLLSLEGPRPYWGLWAIVAGWQLSGTARIDVHRIRWRQLARETLLEEVVVPPGRLLATTPIDDAIEPLLSGGHDAPLAVTDVTGQIVGLLLFENLRTARRSDWSRRSVDQVMTPLAKYPKLPADASARDALDLLDDQNAAAIVITAPGNPVEPVGVVSRRQLLGRLHDRSRS